MTNSNTMLSRLRPAGAIASRAESHKAGLLAMVLVVLFATACTKSEAGQPSAGGGSGPTSTTGSRGGSAPTVAIPPRPKDLKLDGLEPCDLFTSAQLGQIKIDRKTKGTSGSQQFKGMKDCSLDQNSAPFDSYNVMAVTSEGIGPWLTGKRNVDAKLSSVAGYAAATYWFRGAKGNQASGCSTSVDVAEGQQLAVDAENDGKRSYTLEQLCQRAEQVAGLAMQTLKTLK